MLKAVLFDLDDTLLGNHMDTFLPQYFSILGSYAEKYLPRDEFLKVLMIATQEMSGNTDPSLTNRDVFWQSFTAQTGLNADELESFFVKFYEEQFPALQAVTQYRETAVSLIKLCQEKGYKVVIATNPMFPHQAVEERLRWAGLPVADYSFDLVTTYENMHTTKPHPAYYEEIISKIDVNPEETLMVGDNWENDIAPAGSVGCHTYWLAPNGEPLPVETDFELVPQMGDLHDLYDLLSSGWLAEPDA